MLDIAGAQSTPVAVAPVAGVAQSSGPVLNIPTVGRSSNQLTVITALCVLAIIAIAGGYVSFVKGDRAAAIATRAREITQLKQQLGTPELIAVATTADQLRLGVGTLQTALASTSPWTSLLTAIADRTPGSIILISLTVDAKLNLRMNGIGGSYGDVAKFLAALQASPSFSTVTLDSSAKSDTTTGSAVAFAVKATFVPTELSSSASSSSPATIIPGSSNGPR